MAIPIPIPIFALSNPLPPVSAESEELKKPVH
jgi:hypothetical protein